MLHIEEGIKKKTDARHHLSLQLQGHAPWPLRLSDMPLIEHR
jgi:hypothetical protein